jgi:hypothetical protein
VEKPPILEYQTHPKPTEVRRLAATVTCLTGILNPILNFLFLPPLVSNGLRMRVVVSQAATCFSAGLACTVVCSLAFIIGGIIVRRRHPIWEIAIMIDAALQSAATLLLAGWCAYNAIFLDWVLAPTLINLSTTGFVFYLMYCTHRRN